MDVLPLARSLEAKDRRILAEELLRTLQDEPISEDVLDLVQERAEYIRQHPEEAIPWEEFEVELDEMFSPPLQNASVPVQHLL